MKPVHDVAWCLWMIMCMFQTPRNVEMNNAPVKQIVPSLKGKEMTPQDQASEREKLQRTSQFKLTTEEHVQLSPVTNSPSLQEDVTAASNSPSLLADPQNAVSVITDSSTPSESASRTSNKIVMDGIESNHPSNVSNNWQRGKKNPNVPATSSQSGMTYWVKVDEANTKPSSRPEPWDDASLVSTTKLPTPVVAFHMTTLKGTVKFPTTDTQQTTTQTHRRHLATTFKPLPRLDKDTTHFNNNSLRKATTSYDDSSETPTFTSTLRRKNKIQCDRRCCACSCKTKRAKCTMLDTCPQWYPPKLPSCIRIFELKGANLVSLTRSMLASLSNFNLTTMQLTSNGILRMDPDTFVDFPYLQTLDLSNNKIPLDQLSRALNNITSTGFYRLTLDNMGLRTLPHDLFHAFTNMSLFKVSIKQNQLQSFDSAAFSSFGHVKYVELSTNNIFRANITNRMNIRVLKLRENNFVEVPDLCLHQSHSVASSAFRNLNGLYIGSSSLSRVPASRLSAVCFPDLVKLEISASDKLYRLENNFVADLPRLQYLIVLEMKKLRYYEPLAFNSSSLKKLTIRNNKKITNIDTSKDHEFTLKYCTNLEMLQIMNTVMRVREETMWNLLAPLTSLRGLYLTDVSMYVLTPDLLWRFPRLQELDVRANGITSSRLGQALQNVTSLRSLRVMSNRITVVNETTLPWPFRGNLTYLDISRNPFSCSCQQRWFKRWLDDVTRNGSVTVNNYQSSYSPYAYICDSPISRRGQPLKDLQLTDEECEELNLILVLGTSGAGVLLMVLSVVVATYRYRWYLKYYVYRCRRQRHEKKDELPLFKYDVYVAYSPGDLDWVCETLLGLLETDNGLTTFLLDRDSMPGTGVADNITRYMDQSARILLLLSDTYTREQWRLFEYEHIIYAAVDQHKDVIVVLLGDVSAGRMTRDMRRMLTRGTFLQWDSSSEEAQRVFKEGLRVALKTEDAAFHTLC